MQNDAQIITKISVHWQKVLAVVEEYKTFQLRVHKFIIYIREENRNFKCFYKENIYLLDQSHKAFFTIKFLLYVSILFIFVIVPVYLNKIPKIQKV